MLELSFFPRFGEGGRTRRTPTRDGSGDAVPKPMKKFLLALAAMMVLGGTSLLASDGKKEEKKECAACKEKGSMCDACKKKAEDKAKEPKH
jgi:hypothetical protein